MNIILIFILGVSISLNNPDPQRAGGIGSTAEQICFFPTTNLDGQTILVPIDCSSLNAKPQNPLIDPIYKQWLCMGDWAAQPKGYCWDNG